MEDALRHQLCRGAHQLWALRLLAGSAGVLSVELSRRRYLVTPPGKRRADLALEQIVTVDLGGQAVNQSAAHGQMPESLWTPHRLAYQLALNPDLRTGLPPRPIKATCLLDPPELHTARHRVTPSANPTAESNGVWLELPGSQHLQVVQPNDQDALTEAIRESNGVWIDGLGLFVAAGSLAACLDAVEVLELAAQQHRLLG